MDRSEESGSPAQEDTLASIEDALLLGRTALRAEVCLLGLSGPRDGWIRTVLGVRPDNVRQMTAFCTFAMMQPDFLWVRDVSEVRSLAHLSPASGSPRSLVGGAITDGNGKRVGGLAVLFPGPREPTPADRVVLSALRRQIATHLEHRRRTERLVAERQQEAGALAMLRGLLRASKTVAIIGTDLAGRITVFSEGAEQMFQMPARAALGRTASFLLAGGPAGAGGGARSRDAPCFSALVEGVGPDTPRARDFRLRRADGSLFHGSIVAALVSSESKGHSGYALITRDVTEERVAQQMKDDFVSMVSHELRTPLTAIRGGLGLLMGEVVGPLPEAVRELVEIAHGSSERLLRVVGDILDVQALASGRLELDFGEVDVRRAAERAAELVGPLAAERSVTVALRRIAATTTLEADMGRVVQVLLNLVSNAVKHSPQGGEVHVDIDAIEDGLRVSVQDAGPGVPPEAQHLLFQRFSRLSREPGGTGLGLAIVKAIVHLHGGEVSYRPAAPCGSIFAFSLPLRRAGRSAAE